MSYSHGSELEPVPLPLPMGQAPTTTAITPAPSSALATKSATTFVIVLLVIIVIALVLWWLLSDDKPTRSTRERPSVKRVRTPTLARELHQRLEERGGANPTVMRSLRSMGTP